MYMYCEIPTNWALIPLPTNCQTKHWPTIRTKAFDPKYLCLYLFFSRDALNSI